MKRWTLVFLLSSIGAIWTGERGVAQQPSCAPSGGLSFICGVQNGEDLVLVPNSQWMLASGMAPGSGLHLVDTRAKTVQKVFAPGRASAVADRTRMSSSNTSMDSRLP